MGRSIVTQQTYVIFLERRTEDATAASSSSRRSSIGRHAAPPLQRRKTLLRRQSTSKPDDWPHDLSPAVKARDAAASVGLGATASPPSRPATPPADAATCEREGSRCWTCPACEEANKYVRSKCNNCGAIKPTEATFF